MKVQVDATGQLRTAAGWGEATVELEDGTTLRGLLERLAANTGALRPHLFDEEGRVQPSLLLVVNGAAVAGGAGAAAARLADGDRVSLMPPVAGG